MGVRAGKLNLSGFYWTPFWFFEQDIGRTQQNLKLDRIVFESFKLKHLKEGTNLAAEKSAKWNRTF